MKNKTERMEIRLSVDQKEQLQTLANFYGKTMSEIIVQLIDYAFMDYLLGSRRASSPDDDSNIYIY